jgi:hypothetical protein
MKGSWWRTFACSNYIVLHTSCCTGYNIIAAEARLDLVLGGQMKKSLGVIVNKLIGYGG